MGEWAVRNPHVHKMSQNKTNEPTYYNSLYHHGVDEKRRVQIPSKWRPSEASIELTLILWPKSNEGPCLRVLPPKEMARLMERLTQCPAAIRKKQF